MHVMRVRVLVPMCVGIAYARANKECRCCCGHVLAAVHMQPGATPPSTTWDGRCRRPPARRSRCASALSRTCRRTPRHARRAGGGSFIMLSIHGPPPRTGPCLPAPGPLMGLNPQPSPSRWAPAGHPLRRARQGALARHPHRQQRAAMDHWMSTLRRGLGCAGARVRQARYTGPTHTLLVHVSGAPPPSAY